MRRGDVVIVTAPGDYGKARPALVVQSDRFNEIHASIVVCLMTSTVIDAPLFRVTVEPTPANGLRTRSQIMIDKVVALRRERVGEAIGRLDTETMVRVNRTLAVWMGLGD